MNLFKKSLAVGLSVLTVASGASTAFAASVGSSSADFVNGASAVVGQDISQGAASERVEVAPGEYATDVYVSQDSSFTATLPKTIILNGAAGASNSGAYQVAVKGNLEGDAVITVEPDESFTLSTVNKNYISATIEQEKTTFDYADGVRENHAVTADGIVTAQGLTAGSWNGHFYFNISKNNEETNEEINYNTVYEMHYNQIDINDNYAIYKDGTYIKPQNAATAKLVGCTDYINCKDAKEIELMRIATTSTSTLKDYGLAFYDNEKNFIQFIGDIIGSAGAQKETISIPENAAFFRTTYFSYTRINQADSPRPEFDCVVKYENTVPEKRAYQDEPIYFSPKVNNAIIGSENADYKSTTSALWLPESYSQTDKPTKLIYYFFGASHYLAYEHFGMERLIEKMSYYRDNGYAILICNGPYNTEEPVGNGCCAPQFIEAYNKSYEYVINNYNIDNKVFVMSGSLGGLNALSYARQNEDKLAGMILLSTWSSVKDARSILNHSFDKYLGTVNWEEDYPAKFESFAPEFKTTPWNIPILGIKIKNGSLSGTPEGSAQKYFNKLKETETNFTQLEDPDIEHGTLCSGFDLETDSQILNWMNTH